MLIYKKIKEIDFKMSKLRYKRNFTDGLTQEEFDEEVSEMAILTTKNTGLPYKILIDYSGKD